MRNLIFVLAIGAVYVAAQPVPYYSRNQTANQDAGAGNANLRDITGRQRDRLVTKIGDASCSPTQPLLGATEKKGYIFGGSCGGAMSFQLVSQTIAQLQVSSSTIGTPYYCSNCSPPKIVVATGTLAGNLADAVGGPFK